MQRTTRLKRPQVPEPGELIDFDDIVGRPKYAGEEMTSGTNIPSVTAETEARQAADQEIWTEIETIEAASDVVDVVGTYAELEAYDTSNLHDKDLIKVLRDETRDDAITYYRFSASSETFSYVGAEGPYYTASETDTLLATKQDTLIAGTNIQIAADGKTISATDTTYDNFVGATALSNGEQGLVPAPLSTDTDKFLQGDGSWGTPTDTTYTAGTNVQISANNEISATDTTYSPFVGASSSVVGAAGLVPQPAIGDQDKYLKGDGTWADVQSGSGATIFYSGLSDGNIFCKYSSGNIGNFRSSTGAAVSHSDFIDAVAAGPVTILGTITPYSPGTNPVMAVATVVDFTDSSALDSRKYVDILLTAVFDLSGQAQQMETPLVRRLYYDLTDPDELYILGGYPLGSTYTAGANIQITNNAISAPVMTGATSSTNGTAGVVPQPLSADSDKFLKGDGTWATVQSGGTMTTFYIGGAPGVFATDTIYKESTLTTAAVQYDIDTALASGGVRICQVVNGVAKYYYDVMSYSTNAGYYTISQYNLDTTLYTFSFDSSTTIEWFKSEVQPKLTAGTGITISSGNVISASGATTNNINSTDWNALWQ